MSVSVQVFLAYIIVLFESLKFWRLFVRKWDQKWNSDMKLWGMYSVCLFAVNFIPAIFIDFGKPLFFATSLKTIFASATIFSTLNIIIVGFNLFFDFDMCMNAQEIFKVAFVLWAIITVMLMGVIPQCALRNSDKVENSVVSEAQSGETEQYVVNTPSSSYMVVESE